MKNNKNRRIIGVLFLFFLVSFCNINVKADWKTVKDYDIHVTKKDTVLYKKADTQKGRIGTLKKGAEVIVDKKVQGEEETWYKVRTIFNNEQTSGFVRAKMIKDSNIRIVSQDGFKGRVSEEATIRNAPSEAAKKVKTIAASKKITVKMTLKVNGRKWCECRYSSGGKTKKGFILQSFVEQDSEEAFQKVLDKFPVSYAEGLKKLHAAHPNWEFKPVYTNQNWNTVIKNEYEFGKNTIMTYVPTGGQASVFSAPFSYLSTDLGAYNWKTDKYKVCDSTVWYTADKKVLKYYMDPRNFLTSKSVFVFEGLYYQKSHNKKVLRQILKGSFMSKTYTYKKGKKKITKKYVDTFYAAGKKYNISPYFLATRSLQELGQKGSDSVSGKVKGYRNLYNYYNIGANDSPGGGAIQNGLTYARGSSDKSFGRPWNNPYKAIMGGAKFFKKNYISQAQYTRYFQKFNVVSKVDRYRHQYMTNIMAPYTEGVKAYQGYKELGVLNEKFTFYIPVYKNMPDKRCKLPKRSGNPNGYLKTLRITDDSGNNITARLNEKFSYKKTAYTLEVPASVKSIRISARPISKYAKVISGTGMKTIKSGKTTTIKIKCRAGNQKITTYKIRVKSKR